MHFPYWYTPEPSPTHGSAYGKHPMTASEELLFCSMPNTNELFGELILHLTRVLASLVVKTVLPSFDTQCCTCARKSNSKVTVSGAPSQVSDFSHELMLPSFLAITVSEEVVKGQQFFCPNSPQQILALLKNRCFHCFVYFLLIH